MRSIRLAVFCAVAVLFAPAVAVAQTAIPTFELEHLTLNPSQQGGMLIGTGELLDEKQFRGALLLHYQHNPLILIEDGKVVGAVVRSRLTAHLAAAYGINKWFEVGLQLPVVLYQAGDTVPQVASPASAGLGTPWIQAKIGFLSQQRQQPIDLSAQVALGLPIGSDSALAKDGSVGFSPRIQAGYKLGFLRVGAEVGALIRSGGPLSPASTAINDEVGSLMQLGANVTTTNEGLRGEATLIGRVPFTRAPASAELLLGGRYPLGPVEVFALAGPGFGRTPGTPAFRVLAGVGLTLPDRRCVEGNTYDPKDCPKLDLDRDGVLNEVDACVREAGVALLAGCPVPDSDGDTILDDVDACPKLKGLVELGGCPDTDQDGIHDGDDRCPNEKGPKENRGCPYGDADADGVKDNDDGCPKFAGPVQNKGCPWPDTDGDTLADPDDGCPKESGPKENKGCPWGDTDGDTVTDNVDNCPKEKGDPANQGCPKAKKQLVVITKEKLVIKEKVFFATAKATIKPQSFGLLTQVADVLNAHPEIAKVVIEGHTDNVGKDETNRVLSLKRAESVRDFLVKQKVDIKRLEAKGYGPDRPADVNTSAAGRENNRRVEFVVVNPETEKSEVKEVAP